MLKYQNQDKRKRGVILTLQELQQLEKAKADVEFRENSGIRYTLEQMSDRTQLAVSHFCFQSA